MKIVSIEPQQFDSFASKHKYRSYYQSSLYGRVMKRFGYEVMYIGINDDSDRTIGASLLLLQEAMMKSKIAYAPRGILFDFTDSVRVEELVSTMKRDLVKMGIISLRMDPTVPITVRDNMGNIVNINNEAKIIMANLTSNGFNYKGQTLYLESEKPRWEALTVLQKDIREIYKGFDKKTRNKINKALKNGIEIYRDDKKDLTNLYDFVKNREKKPFNYYKALVRSFGKNADVFYAKLNTEQFVINSKTLYENELAKNEQISSQFQELAQQKGDRREIFNQKVLSDKLLTVYKSNLIFATNVLKAYPKGIIIGGALNIVYDNAAYLITEGFDAKYGSLNPNYLLKWRMISDYQNENLKYYNLNAIAGNFSKKNKMAQLNESKLGFNTMVTEYIGEYDIVLNNFKYGIYKNFNK